MYKILAEDKKTAARFGELKTAHGILETPLYMPCATKTAVKFITFDQLEKVKTQAVISNSLVIYFTLGLDTIEKAGGIHKFMKWNKGVFTDSGGFQMLRDSFQVESFPRGVYFKSPFDGKKHLIEPETAMEIQYKIGSDVAMVLDDVQHYGVGYEAMKESLKKTHYWAERCKKAHDRLDKDNKQLLFGIAQGGIFKDLREKSIEFLKNLNFDGYALGGLAIGEPLSDMREMMEYCIPLLPNDKPRYLMGVGSPEDMLEAISLGVDIFDSTFPTQNARHGTLFTFDGKVKIKKKEYKEDMSPIDKNCSCFICKNYTRAYLHYLSRMDEAAGKILNTHHNLHFMQDLLNKAKQHIKEGTFNEFKENIVKKYRKDNKKIVGSGVKK